MVLFEVRNEAALIFAEHDLGKELGDAEKFQEFEEISLASQLVLSHLVPLQSLVASFVALAVLEAAFEPAKGLEEEPGAEVLAIAVLVASLGFQPFPEVGTGVRMIFWH